MEDFAKAIAYEVRQEIASRYFGFRTRIETDISEYTAMLQEVRLKLETIIGLDLCRLRFLLQEPRLFCSFLQLTGLPREYATDLTCSQSSPRVQDLFCSIKTQGFTRWRRFRGLAITSYQSLEKSIATYNTAYHDLQEEHADICREIEKFQRQNDLSDILCYLRDLDSLDAERLKFLHAGVTLQGGSNLDLELRISPPPHVAESLILLTPLPPLQRIKDQLTAILKQAFAHIDCSIMPQLPI